MGIIVVFVLMALEGWLRHEGGKLATGFLLLSAAFKINLQANALETSQQMPCDLQLDCQVIFSNISSFTDFL